MRRWLVTTTLVGGLAVALAVPALADLQSVSVGSFYYEDATSGDGKVDINAGDQIKFVFSGNVQHSATVAGLFDSGVKKPGQTYTTGALMTAGTYTIYCTVHGASRHHTTLVIHSTAPAAPPSPTPSPTSSSTTGGSTTGGSTTGGSSGRTTTGGSTTGGSTTGGSTSGGSTTGGTSTGGTTAVKATATPRPVATSITAASKTVIALGHPKASPSSSLAPVGDGLANARDLAGAPSASGSLAQSLGRAPSTRGSWTRAVGQALLGLLPMALAGWWALRRRPSGE